MTEKETDGKSEKSKSKVSMTAPWNVQGGPYRNVATRFSRGDIPSQFGETIGDIDLNRFVKERSLVHSEYIRQAETTKRWAMIVGCICIVASAIILIFAPEGRESVSYLIGLVLFIVAGGAFGYGRVWMKNNKGEIGASRD